ncbi:MAG: hypothetical protein ACTHU1_01600 [Arachnia sp.]
MCERESSAIYEREREREPVAEAAGHAASSRSEGDMRRGGHWLRSSGSGFDVVGSGCGVSGYLLTWAWVDAACPAIY